MTLLWNTPWRLYIHSSSATMRRTIRPLCVVGAPLQPSEFERLGDRLRLMPRGPCGIEMTIHTVWIDESVSHGPLRVRYNVGDFGYYV